MKTSFFFCALLCSGALVSCSTQMDDMLIATSTDPVETVTSDSTQFFPVADDAVLLTGTHAEQMLQLLNVIDPSQALVLYDTNITDEQFQEIKAFTETLVIGLTSQKEIHDKIFGWITSNIKYEESDNDPYPVFKNRKGICQGYANLLKVMLLSQNVPVISINGTMYGMGHAWTYVCADGQWYMSDPTNGVVKVAKEISTYVGYEPSRAEFAFFNDDHYLFEYNNGQLNLKEVKQGSEKFTVPYSAGGFVITSFSPEVDLPSNIKEIYIGKNIKSLGDQGVVGIQSHGQGVESIHIDPENPSLESYEGLVYRKEGDTTTPYFIPANITRIVLKPAKVYNKGVIVDHENVEEIVFPEGVEVIGDYAIEKCPNLKRVYVPENALVSRKALYNIWQDVEIIREKTETGIHSVTMD